ncbi:MAG: hypothetical protein IJJ66_04865 [Treponema sp.]|nr:hypothetical protein [Treponema sp.]
MSSTKKKILVAFFAICLCIPHAFSHDERKADVVVCLKNGKELTRIFTGNIPGDYDVSALIDNKLNENLILLDEKIKSAKEIVDLKIEKARLPGGEEYLIEYLSEGKKYSVINEYWICEKNSHKIYRCNLIEELRAIYYSYSHQELISDYYKKKSLSAEDCKNIDFVKMIFCYETNLNIDKKNVEIIERNYSGGVPVQTEQLPIYYRVLISDEEYAAYKKLIRKQYKDDWMLYRGELVLRLLTKFDLGCTIKKNEIIFGFSKMDMIHP